MLLRVSQVSNGSIQWLAPPKNTGDSVTSAREDRAATEEALADDANTSLQSRTPFYRRHFCQFPEKVAEMPDNKIVS